MSSKYRAKKVVVDGITFDSKREAERYKTLKRLESAGVIRDLELQRKFILIPAQREESTEVYKSGLRKGEPKPGKTIERECSYIADFVYTENGRTVVEDSKGVRTKEYILKRKMMLYFYGIRINEV